MLGAYVQGLSQTGNSNHNVQLARKRGNIQCSSIVTSTRLSASEVPVALMPVFLRSNASLYGL